MGIMSFFEKKFIIANVIITTVRVIIKTPAIISLFSFTLSISAKAGVEKTLTRFAELRVNDVDASALGKELSVDGFEPNTYVDVTGTSKGKGFQGVIKRYGFQGGPKTHGSKFHRAPGSIGQCATPARVFKQKKMPGHMGDKTTTIQNIKVVELNTDKGYMLLKGSLPGSKNGFIRVSQAVKRG